MENQSANHIQKAVTKQKHPRVAPPDFHHVVFMTDDIEPMLFVRDDHQEITALVSVKMTHEKAQKLKALLDGYLENYQDGGDIFMYTLKGKFR